MVSRRSSCAVGGQRAHDSNSGAFGHGIPERGCFLSELLFAVDQRYTEMNTSPHPDRYCGQLVVTNRLQPGVRGEHEKRAADRTQAVPGCDPCLRCCRDQHSVSRAYTAIRLHRYSGRAHDGPRIPAQHFTLACGAVDATEGCHGPGGLLTNSISRSRMRPHAWRLRRFYCMVRAEGKELCKGYVEQ